MGYRRAHCAPVKSSDNDFWYFVTMKVFFLILLFVILIKSFVFCGKLYTFASYTNRIDCILKLWKLASRINDEQIQFSCSFREESSNFVCFARRAMLMAAIVCYWITKHFAMFFFCLLILTFSVRNTFRILIKLNALRSSCNAGGSCAIHTSAKWSKTCVKTTNCWNFHRK